MKGIILAAGYATRLYPLTLNRAKALLPVHGRPIIDYIVDEMNTLDDLDQIAVISNHRFADQFAEWAERRRRTDRPGSLPIVVLDDGTMSEADRLGAIGDIQFGIEKLHIQDDLLIIAGDNLFTYRLRDAWNHFRAHGEDMILARSMPPGEDLRRYAIAVLDDQGRVQDLAEKPAQPKSNLAVFATYFYCRETAPLIGQYLREGNKPDAPGHFPVWLYQRKPLRCFLFDGLCIDIGTPESYAEVEKIFPVRP
ncbi:MAG TPA: nucleotidyltransferase family protein [Clostridiales bacterium]|nr:nucleotidyltransferase family protein [Clostridiales bacterium]